MIEHYASFSIYSIFIERREHITASKFIWLFTYLESKIIKHYYNDQLFFASLKYIYTNNMLFYYAAI